MTIDDWPVEMRLSADRRSLTLIDGAGRASVLAAEYLRVESPSAEVRGHGPGQEVLVAGKAQIAIAALEPVGNYALRIVFDDREQRSTQRHQHRRNPETTSGRSIQAR